MFQFMRGFGYVFKGFGLINQKGIRRYVAIPLLINIILFAVVIWYGADRFEALLDYMDALLLGWEFPSWLGWLQSLLHVIFRWILWPVFVISVLLLVFYTFTLIANLIGAPFNALLAEKLELQLSARSLPETRGVKAQVIGIGSAFKNEFKKLIYLLLWAIPLLLLFFIPGINIAAPFIWLIFSAWMLALEYADYPMGNHNMSFAEERKLLKKRRSLALGFGGGVMLMTAIPFLNFFAMPVGVAGATAMWVDKLYDAASSHLDDA